MSGPSQLLLQSCWFLWVSGHPAPLKPLQAVPLQGGTHPRQPSLPSIGSLALCPSPDGTDFNSVLCMAVPLLCWELGRPLTGVPEPAGQGRTSTCRSPPPSLLPCCPLHPAWLSAMSHFTDGKTESQRRGVTCPGSHSKSGSVFLSHVPEHRGGGGLLPSQGP